MNANIELAQALLHRLPTDQLTVAVRFLQSLLVEDEEISPKEEAAGARSKEWFNTNPGIPFEQLVADLGFSKDEIRFSEEHSDARRIHTVLHRKDAHR